MTSPRGRRAALRLAALLATSDTLHFAKPRPFDTLIPPELPGTPRAWTYASGAAELGVAGLLANPATRRLGGTLAAVLFVAVLPGNVQAVRVFRRRPLVLAAMVARLPLQVPLVIAALRARE